MLNKKKNNKGFTLVELLVVIAIIGILAVVAVPALFKNIEKSKVADLEADISAIKSATMSYVAENNQFPTGNLDSDKAIVKAFNGELENLSNSFDATYNLALSNSSNESNGIVAGDVVLTVTLAGQKTFSVNSLKKLYNDLDDALLTIDGEIASSEPLKAANSVTIKITNTGIVSE